MNKSIEQSLNLPRLEDALKEFSAKVEEAEQVSAEVDAMSNMLQNTLPSDYSERDETGVDEHEQEMNEIYSQALKAHKEILDLGFNVEAKTAGTIFEPAARFLDIALSASKSKSEQKLKTLKTRMDREKLNSDLRTTEEGTIDSVTPAGFIADRNDLLRELVGKMRDSNAKK